MGKKLLVVVDYQTDFVTGALANPAAEALEEGIAQAVRRHLEADGAVLFTKDTHPAEYLETREGKFLPVPHCLKGTDGWRLFGSLSEYEEGVRDRVAVVEKPTFGSAALPGAVLTLCGGEPESIEICGVVTDICVISNAVLLHSCFLNAPVTVHGSLCAAMTPENHQRALDVLAGMGYGIA